MRRSPAQVRAFTLVEAAVSVAIVGVLVVASTATLGSIARARQVQVESRLGTLLAQQLMTEALQQPFQRAGTTPVFGAVAGQTRAAFDSVDAYDGYSATPPASQTGAALTDYAGWTQAVAVAYVDPATLAPAGMVTTLKRVTVTVTAPSGKPSVMVGLRSKFAAAEQVPTVQIKYVTGVSVSLKAAGPKTVYAGAHPLNVTSPQ